MLPTTRRGAADPRILSTLIIAAGFLGLILFYFLEPLLVSPPEEDPRDRVAAEPTIPVGEVRAAFAAARAETDSLYADGAYAQQSFGAGVDGLVKELVPSGEGFSCPRIDGAKYALQQRQPALASLHEWLVLNARRHNDPAIRSQLVRLQQELDAILKAMERVITGFQSMNTARMPKGAESALKKLAPLWKSYFTLLERCRTFLGTVTF